MLKRALTAAGLLVVLGVAPLATAAPASATASQCTGILNSYGYTVGAKSTAACGWRHKTGFGGVVLANPNCLNGLVALGVKYSHAETACEWA